MCNPGGIMTKRRTAHLESASVSAQHPSGLTADSVFIADRSGRGRDQGGGTAQDGRMLIDMSAVLGAVSASWDAVSAGRFYVVLFFSCFMKVTYDSRPGPVPRRSQRPKDCDYPRGGDTNADGGFPRSRQPTHGSDFDPDPLCLLPCHPSIHPFHPRIQPFPSVVPPSPLRCPPRAKSASCSITARGARNAWDTSHGRDFMPRPLSPQQAPCEHANKVM